MRPRLASSSSYSPSRRPARSSSSISARSRSVSRSFSAASISREDISAAVAFHFPYAAVNADSSPPQRPKPSRKRRWLASSIRRRPSFWPCTSTSRAPSALSCAADTGSPFTRQAERPSALMRRRMMSSSSGSMPLSASHASDCSDGVNTAVTDACALPVRTISRLTRPPSMAPSESMTMDLPAPVSPVRTLRPGPKAMSERRMTATFSMCSSVSTENTPSRHSISSISWQKRSAAALSRMARNAVSSPASVPTRSWMFMPSSVEHAAFARPGRVLMTMMFCATA